MSLFTSCEGVFDGLYDDAKTAPPIDGTLYIEAKEWDKWYYIDLQTLHEHIKDDPLYDVNKDWQSFNIPMADTDTPKEYVSGHHKTGQYMYWFDGTMSSDILHRQKSRRHQRSGHSLCTEAKYAPMAELYWKHRLQTSWT